MEMMARRFLIRTCLYLFLLTSSFTAHAINLGGLTLNSYLGQPFKAEIDIISIEKENISVLSAKLASPESFRQLNVDYASFLTDFEINIENRSNGQPYIRITSSQPVAEPFLSFLIEFKWSSGLLIKEFTVLLDSLEERSNPTLPALQADSVVSNSGPKEVGDVKQLDAFYVPVVHGDNLTKIAQKIKYPKIQLNQLLVALYRANIKAFSDSNMNRLKTGAILRVPDVSEVATISPEEANNEVKIQVKNWELYRQRLAAEVDNAGPISEEPAQIATGKISTKIDKFIKAKKQPKEKLSISNGEGVIKGGSGKKIKNTSQEDYIAALEDSAIAKEKALNEANKNLAILEKNIKKLQQLLELRSAGISEVDTSVENASKMATGAKVSPTITHETVVNSSQSMQNNTGLSRPIEKNLDVIDTMNDGHEVSSSKVGANSLLIKKEDFPTSIGAIINNLIENIVYVGVALLLFLIVIFAIKDRKKKIINNESDPEVSARGTEKDHKNIEDIVISDTLVSDNIKDIDNSGFSDGLQAEETTANPVLSEEDLSDINLNIAGSSSAEIIASQLAKKSEKWHEIATKIDLARAYQEMGDNESVKEVIQEILKYGDAEQRKAAKNILENL
ncbi:MAG: hypothetical protein CMH70_04140 [Nitrosomonadaceae bacterium]|nr:hypothetical protein [Nitrosomonadaceae bacterium]|tara:strand:+ start:10142 stop:12001 length:1860 start_codon:yes stop_codon:yes gene_type:complete